MSEAETIPNTADAAFVLATLAKVLPSSLKREQTDCLDKSLEYIRRMPSEHDRLGRFELLADIASNIDTAKAKAILREAFKNISVTDNKSLAVRRRQLIDLAYRIDSDLPSSLASLIDDDPARATVDKQIKKASQFRDITDSLSNERIEMPSQVKNERECANAAWELVGKLNAGRISSIHIDKVRELLAPATRMPLGLSFPIVSFAYESIIRTYQSGDQAIEHIRKIFNASARVVDLVFAVLERSSALDKKARWTEIKKGDRKAGAVEPGSRQQAIEWIKEWVRSLDDGMPRRPPKFPQLWPLENPPS